MAATSTMAFLLVMGFALQCEVGALAVSKSRHQQEPVEKEVADEGPIRKVITLIEEMKATVEKDGSDDLEAYDKYMCWCETNDKEKTTAIENAETRIAELTAFIEEAAATEGQLKTEIAGLAADIEEDTTALETATGVREKEHSDFLEVEADMKETRGLLKGAMDTLSKVQLLQRGSSAQEKRAARAALVQVKNLVRKGVDHKRFAKFQGVMQRDMFDVLGSFEDVLADNGVSDRAAPSAAFLGERAAGKLLPWEKTEEQIGMEGKPNEEKGNAAGTKSYNSRSGRILGILDEMHSEFTRDLIDAQKADFAAEVAFQKLRAAKLAEIAAATEQKEAKEAALADIMAQAAKAKENKESVEAALSADEKFLMELKEGCKFEDEEYHKRLKVRNEELRALGEVLKILTSDEARDLYAKSDVSFAQLRMRKGQEASAQKMREQQLLEKAVERIVTVARKNKDWAMVSLAVRAKLDAFTKVKEVMDKMLVELQKQQKDEYEKWEFCKESIDTTEDKIKVATRLKEDLAGEHQNLVNTIETLEANIAMLKNEVADMEVSLKQAGEERRAANKIYQTSVADQRATINILEKAMKRLNMFYNSPKFIQVGKKAREPVYAAGAGVATAAPGTYKMSYEKNAMSGGVIDLVKKVIEDATANEAELTASENQEQTDYAKFVNVATESIEADRASIREKEGQLAENMAAKSECEEAQLANEADLTTLTELMKAHHLECDYLLKYFDIRQTARAEEMNAIVEAKAILSGADFGR
jgi:hypothetical protein